MFFCVLLISTTNISDYNVNYTNNRFHSKIYNAVRTSEDTQQNTIFENLLRNDKIQTKDGASSERDQSTNKHNLYSDLRCDQHTCETENLALTPSKDSEELSQHTENTNFLNQDYSILDVGTNTPQYWDDVFSATDVSHTNKVERTLPFTNNNHIPAQTNVYSDSCLLTQIESIPVVQENESLTELLKARCTDYYTEFNNQNINDPDFENEWYKKICSYINWEPSEYDNKKNFFQEFNFENDNNNSVDSSFKQCSLDKYADFYTKEVGEYCKANDKKFSNNDDLNANDTKDQEKRSEKLAVDFYSSKSYSSVDSNIEFNNILIENKKVLQALKDKFFVNVRKQSPTDIIHFNLSKNSKYHSIRRCIILHFRWFRNFTNETFELLMNDIETLYLSENTKKFLFELVEFLREVAQFIVSFKSHFNLRKHNKCNLISNLTLIEAIMNEIILKFDSKEIKIFLNQVIQKNDNAKLSDLNGQKVLPQILYNIRWFEKKFKRYVYYIIRLKNFLKKL